MSQAPSPKLLEAPTFSAEQLSDTLGAARSHSNAGPLFDFTLKLPRGWWVSFYPDAVPQAGTQPELLFHASPEHTRDVEIRIWATVLTREINPVDWLDQWLDFTEHGIIDAKNFDTDYGVLADVLTHRLDKSVPGTRRSLTIKDGNRLFLIEAKARRDDENLITLMQNAFLVAASSFELAHPTRDRFAEPFDDVTTEGALPLTLLAPESWQMTAQQKAPPDGAAITWDNNGFGTLMLSTMPGCDNSEMLEEVLLGTLEANGVKIPEPDESTLLVPSAFMNILARSDRALRGGEVEMIVMTARAETPEVSACLALLSPSEQSNRDAMAVNRRAFQVMLQSLRPAG
ncbi:hypothetical protein [Vannielia litorea]|uniref:hypothetical protein n=1 Tax=Vannielia litorea TaxID=1217970 RepID=UPI001C9745D3|nr:hypothetical protein [Vannielia litorea]MBY6047665.1 hypothetical protein [Vannielia litorea]MBY6075079.1 hypothetical protein [Vannielia litorea]